MMAAWTLDVRWMEERGELMETGLFNFFSDYWDFNMVTCRRSSNELKNKSFNQLECGAFPNV